jgi:FMN phosphatase YigB (HAD superfamily)
MNKKKIFLDFDGTIFDTSLYRDILFEIFGEAGFLKSEILSNYEEECLDYKFSPEGLVERLGRIRSFDQTKVLKRIDNSYLKIPKLLYNDTFNFLQSINRDLYTVDLLSLGDITFQKKKINHSGLLSHFDKVYITDVQKWHYLKEIVGNEDHFIIIDDRADTIKNVGESFPNALPIEIRRGDADRDDPMRTSIVAGVLKKDDNLTIRSLSQAMKYL